MICKLNDMAYIKKALRPANIGRVITCKELLGYFIQGEEYLWNGEVYLAQDTDYIWVVESPSGLDTLYGKSLMATAPDSWLVPIKMDGLTDEEFAEEELANGDLVDINV